MRLNDDTQIPIKWLMGGVLLLLAAGGWATRLEIITSQNSREIEIIKMRQDVQTDMLQEIRETLIEIKVKLSRDEPREANRKNSKAASS